MTKEHQAAIDAIRESKWRPLGDHIFVLPIPSKDVTAGGIVLPRKNDHLLQWTTTPLDDATDLVASLVLAVGPGAYTCEGAFVTPDVYVGEIVLHSIFAGVEMKGLFGASVVLEGLSIRVMAECDVQAAVEMEA